MTIEQQISDLVTSSNQLTNAVENKVQEIDQKLVQAENKFDDWRNGRDILGEPLGYGTVKKAIFQGFIYRTNEASVYGRGDFEGKVEPLGNDNLVYVHLKTPLNINVHSEMFWFNVQGYSYGSAKIINEIMVGYCYAGGNVLSSKSSFGELSPDSYTDTAGNVVLRLLLPNSYHSTMAVDTMRVGNGRLFNNGDLDVKLSLSDTVEL